MDQTAEGNPPPTIVTTTAPPSKPPQPLLKTIFLGPNGIRAGWRFLIFVLIVQALLFAEGMAVRLLHLRRGLPGTLTPIQVIVFESAVLLLVILASWIMAKIERRKLGDYGLPWKAGIGKHFFEGASWGFLAISGTLFTIFALHGFRITGLAIHGTTILTSTVVWSIAFVLVGFSEEFTFRGYPQFTLATGIGFWPAAVLLSALFAWFHKGNSGETAFGLLSVVIFGLLFCWILWRTGNLWWAVGFHAGWDWGQTFFYGVHDSGLAPYNNLLNSEFFGPTWLTGGTVGPESSIFCPIALGIVALLLTLRYREPQYRASGPPGIPKRT
jgi:uncharacterized protein